MRLHRRALLQSGLGAGAAAFAPAAAFATTGGFDASSFEAWVDARVGQGPPVYWYSIGTAKAYPSGDLICLMEGFDTARMHRPDPNRPLVHQYNRKIYIFRDAATGALLREYQGRPVTPIAYPYKFITYELVGDRIVTFVEQGAAPRVQRIGPGDSMSVRRVGDSFVFSAPVYLDFPIPGGEARYQAFENYDFVVTPARGLVEPHLLSWLRTGPMPPWAQGRPSVMHLVTWRMDAFAELPEDLRAYIEAEQPLWRAPPADLAEIRTLQAGG